MPKAAKRFVVTQLIVVPLLVVTSTLLFIALAVLEGKFSATFSYIELMQFAFTFFYIPLSILFSNILEFVSQIT